MVPLMLRHFFHRIAIAVAIVFSIQSVAAETSRISDRIGRWICEPDNPAWPQVLVDFEESAYRRCDQNTCVSYPIPNIEQHTDAVVLAFAPGAFMRVPDTGGRYRETLSTSGQLMHMRGQCAYRGTSDIPDPDAVRSPR